jgi:DMSO reductase anchor subunit
VNPAPSIVFFTTASGAGYGLLFWLGRAAPAWGGARRRPRSARRRSWWRWRSSRRGCSPRSAHLGNPQRAWRALSQWRSSWLSREGVAAVLTYPPALLLLLALWSGWPAP